MMDSTESERMSGLLSTYLERKFTGTQEQVDIRRRRHVLKEHFHSFYDNEFFYCIETGSQRDGITMLGSDEDQMIVNKLVTVMYLDQCIPPNMAHQTILYMREADCRPGYVHLQLGQRGPRCNELLFNSLVRIENSTFVSSDIYREGVTSAITIPGVKLESNGPSSTIRSGAMEIDTAICFPCNSWPKEANEWITRTRLYGWPHQTLLDKIVHSGCHLVPVGDKCSEDTFLQWRISFATAEIPLIHSFSHIQFKVYCLLKYFLKQIKETLKETIGDDDILCSYFLKTTLFHAIENSNKVLWQDKNLFYCFWFCFNILIAWVRAGFCPNYFIPGNNLFQRKVHGQHQQILIDVLNNFCQMKWMCLSVGNFFKPSIWEHLCNTSIQAQLVHPRTVQEILFNQDRTIVAVLSPTSSLRSLRKLLHSLSKTQSDSDEVFTYYYAMKRLEARATEQLYPDHRVATGNKARYRTLKKCKHWMIPNASMGTELLHLATFHFLTGNISKPLEMCKQVKKLASCYTGNSNFILHPEIEAIHRHEYLQSGHTLDRLRKIYARTINFDDRNICLPHLCLELSQEPFHLLIPPLPYALFLSFLCCHELGDTRGCYAVLHQLIEIQYDDEQGGHLYWIVHTLLGICYQTLGDNHRAIRAYWDSAQSKAAFPEWNPVIKRIAIVYLCMYASQRSDRG